MGGILSLCTDYYFCWSYFIVCVPHESRGRKQSTLSSTSASLWSLYLWGLEKRAHTCSTHFYTWAWLHGVSFIPPWGHFNMFVQYLYLEVQCSFFRLCALTEVRIKRKWPIMMSHCCHELEVPSYQRINCALMLFKDQFKPLKACLDTADLS